MYNFGIPRTLKAWTDRIGVAGKTLQFTGEGPRRGVGAAEFAARRDALAA